MTETKWFASEHLGQIYGESRYENCKEDEKDAVMFFDCLDNWTFPNDEQTGLERRGILCQNDCTSDGKKMWWGCYNKCMTEEI